MFNQCRWKRTIALFALIPAAALTACRSADPFPASAAVAGWEKTTATRTFAAADLWQYIDGEAEAYIRAGVVSASTSDYKYQGRLEATVDIYTMKAASGAGEIFAKESARDARSVALGDAGLANAQSVIFHKGPHLVRIVAYQSAPATQQALLDLARGVEGKL
jgi:hypothetical protein